MTTIGVPVWQAATSGQTPQSSQINQLLGTHPNIIINTGVQQVSFNTGGSGSINSNTQYMAQSFTTAVAQTTVGYITAQIGPTSGLGSVLAPITVGLYANSAGAPTGSALVSVTITAEYSNAGPVDLVIPLPVTGLTASTLYWIVVSPTTGSQNYVWVKSSQVTGASTSPNGTVWTAQAFGLRHQVYDGTAVGNVVSQWEDGGARWTWTGYAASTTLVSQYAEYTVGQTVAGYLQSFRTFTYSSGLLIGVS